MTAIATPELTMARYFTATVDYLRTQTTRCGYVPEPGEGPIREDDFACQYEHEGNVCAVGYWIPEGHAARTGADGEVYDLAGDYPDLAGVAWPKTGVTVNGVPADLEHPAYPAYDVGIDLASELQLLHDTLNFRGAGGGGLSQHGEARARLIAEDFAEWGVVYTPPEVNPS